MPNCVMCGRDIPKGVACWMQTDVPVDQRGCVCVECHDDSR